MSVLVAFYDLSIDEALLWTGPDKTPITLRKKCEAGRNTFGVFALTMSFVRTTFETGLYCVRSHCKFYSLRSTI